MKNLFYSFLVLSCFYSQFAFSEPEEKVAVEYELIGFFGENYDPKIPSETKKESLNEPLNPTSLVDGVESLNYRQKHTRAVQVIHQVAHDLRISNSKYTLTYVRKIPFLRGEKGEMEELVSQLEDMGLEFERKSSVAPRRSFISPDLEEPLKDYQRRTEQLMGKLLTLVLGLSEVKEGVLIFSTPPEEALDRLFGVMFEPISKEIQNFHVMKEIEFPDRVFTDKENLRWSTASFNQAELNWYESVNSLYSSMGRVIERLHGLKSYSLEKFAKEAMATENTINSYFARHSEAPDNFEGLTHKKQRLVEKIAQAGANTIGSFSYDAKHTQLNYDRVSPNILIPLYSFGALAAVQYYERLSSFDPKSYAYIQFEQVYNNILYNLLKESFRLDIYTEALLKHISQNQGLHSLLRLSAFSKLSEYHGIDKTEKITGIDKGTWEKLYAQTQERVTLSPAQLGHDNLVPHIDYKKNQRTSVLNLFDSIESTRREYGVAPVELPSRSEVNDMSLPENSGSTRMDALWRFLRTGESPVAADHPSLQLPRRKVNWNEQSSKSSDASVEGSGSSNVIDLFSRKPPCGKVID